MTNTTPDEIILSAEHITKVYPGTVALQDVSMKIYRGKVNVLIGENGAGKSTLMKILAGVETATSGRFLLNGEEITVHSPRDAARHGIGIIYQELNLYGNLSVAENIFMAREMTTPFWTIKESEQREVAAQLMKRLEQDIDPKTIVGDLRIGQQQIIEIAKSLARNVRVLIMDEPTSALSNTEVQILFRIIRELKAQDVAIVYISHKLDELLQIGDYFTVLRDGLFTTQPFQHNADLLLSIMLPSGLATDVLDGRFGGYFLAYFFAPFMMSSRWKVSSILAHPRVRVRLKRNKYILPFTVPNFSTTETSSRNPDRDQLRSALLGQGLSYRKINIALGIH